MTYSIATSLYILIYSFTITFTLLIHVSIFNGLQCYSITLLPRFLFLNTFILNLFRLLYLNNHTLYYIHTFYILFLKLNRQFILFIFYISMEQIVSHDINKLLYSISYKYNLDLALLQKRYLPIISIEKKKFKIKRTVPRKYNTTLLPSQHRCSARIWDNGLVHLDISTNTWTYGSQCKHTPFGQAEYCSTHLNVIKRNGHLSHGDFFQPPPHSHFEKFKMKS